MDFLAPIVQIILFFWGPVSHQIGYLKDLNDNVTSLMKETEELKCKRDEIQGDVDDAVSVGKTRVCLVENWLTDVRNVEAQVDSIKSEFDERRRCLNGCCTDHFSRYKLGKRVVKRLKDVETLKRKGVFEKVAASPRRSGVLEMQTSLPHGQQSTSEQSLEQIWQCLHDEENSIIFIYGMGGIGKTTLMKAINNRLVGTNDFNIVIWVTVSKDHNLGLIQERIGNKLDIAFRSNECLEDKRNRLFARLKNVRYMLILDDLWQAFRLGEVGVPKPDKQNRCKIAVTTRSVEVCNQMGANKKIKVKNLTSEEAWDLFCQKTGDVVLLPKIQRLAEEVVRECGGLPLAVKTVGGAMRDKGEEELWKNALRALKGSAPEISGMEREVFLPLKYSYDCLGDPLLQLCFLYCSLYPEDWEIPSEELVTYWAMEEGFINNVDNLEEALNKGHAILRTLKDACLLEEGGTKSHKFIKMHDLLRDLAIWITSSPPSSSSSSSSSSIQASKFLVKAGKGLVHSPEEKMWKGMSRISLMQNNISTLNISPNCPDLVSLFLSRNNALRTIYPSFFELMPKLQILDLSCTSIESIPESLSLLVNLQALILFHCDQLVEISPLGQVQGLKQLDLSFTKVGSEIPCNIISRLTRLEELRLLGSKNTSVDILREIMNLTRLTYLTINISSHGLTAHDLNQRLWWQLKTFNVHINVHNVLYHEARGAKAMYIYDCDNFPSGNEELTRCARNLSIESCKGLAHRSLLGLDHFQHLKILRCNDLARISLLGLDHLKCLRGINVSFCDGLKCIIDWTEVRDVALECLDYLSVRYLPNLEKVFDGLPLPPTRFQRLRKIVVRRCHKLRCLFSSSMVDHLRNLKVLIVFECGELEELVQGDVFPEDAFSILRKLSLRILPKLSSICSDERLIFTSLREVKVCACPELKKLPQLCSGIKELKGFVKGSREWWEGIEWEDEHSKSLYSTLYTEEAGLWSSLFADTDSEEAEEDGSKPE